MGDRQHYLPELLEVDHDYKNKGIGSQQLQYACEEADKNGHPIFVQSGSAAAGGYYVKLGLGFKMHYEVTWRGYKPCLLVRPTFARGT